MSKIWRVARTLTPIFFILTSIVISAYAGIGRVSAAPVDPPGPDRFADVLVDYTIYEWWMAEWEDDEVHCSVPVDHEGPPTPYDVYVNCSEYVYEHWVSQPPCAAPTIAEGRAYCEGFYAYLISSTPAQKEVAAPLPSVEVQLTMPTCTSTSSSSHLCNDLQPKIRLTGIEPLPDESIVRIAGELDGEPFVCERPACNVRLSETDEDGVELTFWAYSTYGDSSEILEARLRVLPAEGFTVEEPIWLVDVISPQWAGAPLLSCAETWEVFPPTTVLPTWLTTPDHPDNLKTNIPYEYLAGNLIRQGAVSTQQCEDGGLLANGYASPCGSEAARDAVSEWQNQFDGLIFTTSQNAGIPAQLLKNLFSRESQFWPGLNPGNPDVGLGQLTENGTDTALMWNPDFYNLFCPLVLSGETCSDGYLKLKDAERELLRAALIQSVNAFCPTCPLGIDVDKANFSVDVFAQTIKANCNQTGQMVYNISKKAPGLVSTYEDLWKMTLINYNAGPGCLAIAINDAYRPGQRLTYEDIVEKLTPACQGAIDYVGDISR